MDIIKWCYANIELIISLTGGSGILGILWKYIIKPRLIMIKKMYDQLNQLSEALPKIQEIYSEIKPNGGASLRDAVNRIESTVNKQRLYTKTLIKSFPGGTFNADEVGGLADVNKNVCTLLGRTESELLKDNWVKWIHPEDRSAVITEWARCLDHNSDFDMDFRFVLPDRTSKKVSMVAYQVRDEYSGLHGFIGTLAPTH